ncbi:ABC transporter ATP-binding protein [Streptomyces sp. NRRL B-24484]|uniref:ABC transporter ATP-binding protein n=1 Tax=Streptomyces sp. NRRL B-24484 TaxID=1463833 RepID=UPI001F24F176|nr:ATP-binding cassette domain-containing protein [Streptomyces sp. NRRL B-24484]
MTEQQIVHVSSLVQGGAARPIINGLDLSVPAGVSGLLGPNGAGKTTLLRTIATVAPPRGGAIELFGREIRSERDARWARRRIGYLPQDFGYYPTFSVADFVRYCAWLREVPGKEIESATKKAIAAVGLSARAGDRMKKLSGGMIRRAGIAAAVVGSPSLVLLDEPTVGLDPAQRLDFRNLIRSLADDGAAVLLSTHLVEDVGAACDAVVVLKEGTAVYRGTPADLAARGLADAPGDTALERGYMTALQGAAMEETC